MQGSFKDLERAAKATVVLEEHDCLTKHVCNGQEKTEKRDYQDKRRTARTHDPQKKMALLLNLFEVGFIREQKHGRERRANAAI